MKRVHQTLFSLSLTFIVAVSADAASTGAGKDPFTPPNFPLPQFKNAQFNVRDFGATGKGLTNETRAINAAIEKCSASGGGDVVFPPGKYIAASIHLKSNVRFVLSPEAVITGDKEGFDPPEPNPYDKFQDYGHSHYHNSLMWGDGITNFAIIGGKVNGGFIIQGDPKGTNAGRGDKVIAIKNGKNLLFQDVTHDTGGHFVYLLNDCENITFTNIVIKKSRDAIDLMGCRNVQVTKCRFTGCSDDTLGIKSDYAMGRKIKSENIYAWDCYFESGCNGLQFGSETAGDFNNINMWDIEIGRAMKAGIGITCNDGAIIENVNYKNIKIRGAASPIYMLITDRLRTGEPNAKIGTIRNVRISDVTVTDCQPGRQGPVFPSTISGRPESSLENITLENVVITYKGGGTKEDAQVQPPYPKDYSPRSLGIRPAAGFYIRHVNGLTFKNVEFAYETEDQRPPLVVEDVKGFRLENFKSPKAADSATARWKKAGVTILNAQGLKDRQSAWIEDGVD